MIKYIFFLCVLTCMATCQYNETNHLTTTYYDYGTYDESQHIQSDECLVFASLSVVNYVNFYISGQNSPVYNLTFTVYLTIQDTNINILTQCNDKEDFCSIYSYDSGYNILTPRKYNLVVCNANTFKDFYYVINFTFDYTNGTSTYIEDADSTSSSNDNEVFEVSEVFIVVLVISIVIIATIVAYFIYKYYLKNMKTNKMRL